MQIANHDRLRKHILSVLPIRKKIFAYVQKIKTPRVCMEPFRLRIHGFCYILQVLSKNKKFFKK